MPDVYTIQPGYLLSLKTSVRGGVSYARQDLPTDVAGQERWETIKSTVDPDEHKRATKLRGRCSSRIRAISIKTSFGLFITEDRLKRLNEILAEIRADVREFNNGAQASRVGVWCVKGKVAATDEEAARGIASDVVDLLAQMDAGIKDLDVEAIRNAATQARQVLGALSPEQQKIATAAVDAARDAASTIARRILKKSEDAAVVLQSIDAGAISAARMAFLDMEGASSEAAAEVAAAPAPAVSLSRFAELGEEVW